MIHTQARQTLHHSVDTLPFRLIGRIPAENGPLFEAYAPDTDRVIALKRLDRIPTDDDQTVARVLESVEQSAAIPHLSLVPPEDVFTLERIYIASEWVDGWNLRHHFLNPTRYELYSPEWSVRICEVFAELCDLLACLHARGLIHRNLSSNNVIISEWQELKVTDAGIVMNPAVCTPGMSPEAVAGAVTGIFYLAPEILKGERPAPGSDLYALGAMLYEMLSGAPPYALLGPAAAAAQKLKEKERSPLHAVNPDADEALEEIAFSLLSHDPAKRPASALEAKHAFDRALEQAGRRSTGRDAQQERIVGRRVLSRTLGHGKLEAAGVKGREQELETLGSLLNEVLQGGFCGIVLAGEAGIGKTRLLREAVRYGTAKLIAGYEGAGSRDRPLPYGLWLPFLERAAAQIGCASPADQHSFFPSACRVLGEICPGFRGLSHVAGAARSPGLPEGEEGKYKVFQAVSLLVDRLNKSSPICFCFDDLQWADRLSLELLLYVARNAVASNGQGFGILTTVRSNEADSAGVLRKLEAVDGFERVDLKPLDRAAVSQMVSTMLGAEQPSPALIDLLMQQTEGNPYFVEELVRSFTAQGIIEEEAQAVFKVNEERLSALHGAGACATRERVPRDIAASMLARLETLAQGTRRILDAAAVCGRDAHIDLLQTLSGTDDEDEFLDALEEGIRNEVLAETGPDRVSLKHEMLRVVVLEGMDPEKRKSLHLKAAASLCPDNRTCHDEDAVIQAAGHLFDAGAGARACALGLHAGRLYKRRHLFGEAERTLKRVLHEIEATGLRTTEGEAQDPVFVETTRELGDLLIERAKYDEALALFEALLAYGRSRDAGEIIVEGLNGMGECYRFKSEPQQAMAALGKSLQIARALGIGKCIARARFELGSIYAEMGNHEKALPALEDAQQGFRALNLEVELARTAFVIGKSLFKKGEVERALGCFASAEEAYGKLGLPIRQAVVHMDVGLCHAQMGNLQEALRQLEKALKIYEEFDDQNNQAVCLNNMAGVYFKLGMTARAIRCGKRSLAISEKLGEKARVANSLVNVARLHLAVGNRKDALQCLQDALAYPEVADNPLIKASIFERLAYIYANVDKATAIQYATQVREVGALLGNRHVETVGLITLGSLCAYETARACVEQALATMKELKLDSLRRDAFHAFARALAKEGCLAQAASFLSKALLELRDLGKGDPHSLLSRSLLNSAYLDLVRTAMKVWSLQTEEPHSLILRRLLEQEMGFESDCVEPVVRLLTYHCPDPSSIPPCRTRSSPTRSDPEGGPHSS